MLSGLQATRPPCLVQGQRYNSCCAQTYAKERSEARRRTPTPRYPTHARKTRAPWGKLSSRRSRRLYHGGLTFYMSIVHTLQSERKATGAFDRRASDAHHQVSPKSSGRPLHPHAATRARSILTSTLFLNVIRLPVGQELPGRVEVSVKVHPGRQWCDDAERLQRLSSGTRYSWHS